MIFKKNLFFIVSLFSIFLNSISYTAISIFDRVKGLPPESKSSVWYVVLMDMVNRDGFSLIGHRDRPESQYAIGKILNLKRLSRQEERLFYFLHKYFYQNTRETAYQPSDETNFLVRELRCEWNAEQLEKALDGFSITVFNLSTDYNALSEKVMEKEPLSDEEEKQLSLLLCYIKQSGPVVPVMKVE